MHKKNPIISISYAIGIVLVVLGHSKRSPIDYPLYYSILLQVINSFHMPLFFILGGYVFTLSTSIERNAKSYFLGRAKRLLLPYIFLSVLSYIPKVLLSKYALVSIDLGLFNLLRSIIYPIENHAKFLWFLPTMFFVNMIGYGIFKFQNAHRSKIVVGLAMTVMYIISYIFPDRSTILNVWGLFRYLPMFCFGSYLYSFFSRESIKFSVKMPWVILSMVISLGINILGNIAVYYKYFDIPVIYAPVFTISGLTFVILLSKVIYQSQLAVLGCVIKLISKWQYQIYLFSWFFMTPVALLFDSIFHCEFWVYSCLMFMIGLTAPIALFKIMVQNFNVQNSRVFCSLTGMKWIGDTSGIKTQENQR